MKKKISFLDTKDQKKLIALLKEEKNVENSEALEIIKTYYFERIGPFLKIILRNNKFVEEITSLACKKFFERRNEIDDKKKATAILFEEIIKVSPQYCEPNTDTFEEIKNYMDAVKQTFG